MLSEIASLFMQRDVTIAIAQEEIIAFHAPGECMEAVVSQAECTLEARLACLGHSVATAKALVHSSVPGLISSPAWDSRVSSKVPDLR